MEIWNSFLSPERTEQERVELTSSITNRLLRYGIGDAEGYDAEIEVLERLYSQLPVEESVRRGFEAFKKFIPRVAEEILNRYQAIRHEIANADIEDLVIGACGLSPLGAVVSAENPGIDVYDTDLPDVIGFRSPIIPSHDNYQVGLWNVLEDERPAVYTGTGPAIVTVEGLYLYLDEEQKQTFNRNLQSGFPEGTKYIFDIYVSDVPAKQRDTVVNTQDPDWQCFLDVVSNVHDGQKSYFSTRDEAAAYLSSQGYGNVRVSEVSREDNAHTIYVCEK